MKRLLLLIPLVLAFLVPAAAMAQGTATVTTANDAKLGTILTDSKGMTLYIYTKDTPGTSTCYDQCATNWPPLLSTATPTLQSGVPGTLSLVKRTDGTQQVAYNGMPLYYFAGDKKAGDTTGQDIGDVWYVVNPSTPTVQTAKDAKLGTILTDGKGMTLYIFTKDSMGVSNCSGDCAKNWPPLTVKEGTTPALAPGVDGTLSLVKRDDGTEQVAYNGMPLYYFVGDKKAGDTTGQDVGDVWYVVNPKEAGTPMASPEGSPTPSMGY